MDYKWICIINGLFLSLSVFGSEGEREKERERERQQQEREREAAERGGEKVCGYKGDI